MYKLYIYFNCPIVILYMFDSKREGAPCREPLVPETLLLFPIFL